MTISNMDTSKKRVLSGMRTTGRLHLGNYFGALKNWIEMQDSHDCFFMAADLHALTTNYADRSNIEKLTWDMIIDWLAAGIDLKKSKVFIQSLVKEHAELHLLLSMVTPLSWLERVPTYKDQKEKLKGHDLSTYGFLGYPLLQAADILLYGADAVPVGEDQVPHIEFAREISRKFNNTYGFALNHEELLTTAISKLTKDDLKRHKKMCRDIQEKGKSEVITFGYEHINSLEYLSESEKTLLINNLTGQGKQILSAPCEMLTHVPKYPGLDGEKMSKSYGNTIYLTEEADTVVAKIKKMTTDPNRVKRNDPGDPNKCPVFSLHKIHSDKDVQSWVIDGCTSAKIGCIDCKLKLCDKITDFQKPIIDKARELRNNIDIVKSDVLESTKLVSLVAQETLKQSYEACNLVKGI